jgi:hypothetical protein
MNDKSIELDTQGNIIPRNSESLLAKARDEQAKVVKKNIYIESRIAEMKMAKARRNRDEGEVFGEDPIFANYIPEFYKTEANRNDMSVHPEIRKMLYSNMNEGVDPRFQIENKEDAFLYETHRDAAINYFEAKKQFYDDAFEN